MNWQKASPLLGVLLAGVFVMQATQAAQGQTYRVLYTFKGTDGQYPKADLAMDSVGNLYGTTYQGGASGFGTAFKLDATGNETVLHSFTGLSDGAFPRAGLVLDSGGNLYGTTYQGGDFFRGTVFKRPLVVSSPP